RVVRLTLRGTNELGEPVVLSLHILLIGRRANLVLEAGGKVVYAWRAGPPYAEPYRPPKGGVATVGEYLDRRRRGVIVPKRRRGLAGELIVGVDGISSSAVGELFRRLDLAPGVVYEQLDEGTLDRLAVVGDELMASAGEVKYYPKEGVISAPPLHSLGEARPVSGEDEIGLVAGFEQVHRRGALVARLTEELDRISGRLRKAVRDKRDALEKAAGVSNLQLAGQLLLTSPDVREPAPESIALPDGGIVGLDPKTSRLANAQRLFERAKRNRRAQDHAGMLDGLIGSLNAEYSELTAAVSPEAPLVDIAELYGRYVERERPTSKGGRSLPAKVGRRMLPGGFTLYWGRDGHANQYVTFRLARPGDVWFHVQQGSGAHVIVRRPTRDAPLSPEVIEEAARLALRYSAMRTAAHVPVVYTERRYIRHRRGAPGAVFYEREKVIYIEDVKKGR
ncbi:DUF814 domain-containing protein, partial [bacterium]|nr:DUF814 domain-containing protein [bacterium]